MKKILRIPYTRVLHCLAPIDGSRLRVLAENTIPPGSAILSVHENHEHRAFDFVIQHESFPETPEGLQLPVIQDLKWEITFLVPPAQGKTELKFKCP